MADSARGEDHAASLWTCPECGADWVETASGDMIHPSPVDDTEARGEDHEAARIAAHHAAQDWVDAAGGDEVDTGHVVDEALNAYLRARPSPEDHEADWRKQRECEHCGTVWRADAVGCDRCGPLAGFVGKCPDHPGPGDIGCEACRTESHDAWMHRAKAAEAKLRKAPVDDTVKLRDLLGYFEERGMTLTAGEVRQAVKALSVDAGKPEAR